MRAVLAEPKSNEQRKPSSERPARRDLQSRLQSTFSAFSDISSQLTRSYLDLEKRVDELQKELVHADYALVQEHYAKEALSERVQLIVNTMPVAVILLDGRGVIMQANTIAEALFERSLPGERWITVINECFAPNPTDGHEIALKNGRLVSLATQSMTHEPGQIIVLNDQTETRRLQTKLNHHRKLSEMGKMTASLAHQIRTPLSTAILYADHLASETLTDERRLRYADKLKSRLLQLEQQVRDMLIFSKGGVVLESVLPIFQLVSVFQSRVEDYCQAGRAQIEFVQDIPSGSVRCNPDLLTSVFSNLIDNAIEACEGVGVRVKIRVNVSPQQGGLVNFMIEDNGPGVSEDIAGQVTEPFFTNKSTGTGLGLAVVKTVIESHGGYFSICNGTEGGAKACMSLPLIQDDLLLSKEA